MSAQPGSDVLVKVYDGVSAYNTIGGLRTKQLSINNQLVDITDGDSTNKFRELLAEAGITSVTMTAAGVFKDSAAEEDVRGYAFAKTINNFQFIIPDFGTIQGGYLVSNITYAGEYDGEATYSMTFESSGDQSWSAA